MADDATKQQAKQISSEGSWTRRRLQQEADDLRRNSPDAARLLLALQELVDLGYLDQRALSRRLPSELLRG